MAKNSPHGVSWREALSNPLYTVASVEYSLDNAEAYCDVSVGSTKTTYWKSYFSYDDDGWNPDDAAGENNSYHYGVVQTVEYEGVTLYYAQMTMWGTAYENSSVSEEIVTWVDTNRNICVRLCLYNSTDEEAALAIAKEILALNSK
ncbi:MAG: hypothetical protein LUI87_19565 [Lachnospiraceae bacterium]|nr:hypothetical protein [Lachnospiraceae bacterium]